MPGYVPLNNVILGSTADANYQSVDGASGGSFRKFNPTIVAVSNGYTIGNDIYKILQYSSSQNIYLNFNAADAPLANAAIGSEIIIYSTSGLVSISIGGGTLRPGNKNVLLIGRLYRLLKTGTLEWSLSGNAGQFDAIPYNNCSDSFVGYVYQLNVGDTFNDNLTVYGNSLGTSLFDSAGDLILIGGNAYLISSGDATSGTCASSYAHQGTDCNGDPVTIYTVIFTFNVANTAYIDSGLVDTYSGGFIYNSQAYSYSSGVGSIITTYAYTGADCNGTELTLYTSNSSFNPGDYTYTDACATSLYTGGFRYNGDTTYIYSNGIGAIVNYYPYTFYNSSGEQQTLYTDAEGLDILIDNIIDNYRWKTSNSYPTAPCNSNNDAPNATVYYRAYDLVYGTLYPVCFTNGYVTSFNDSCT